MGHTRGFFTAAGMAAASALYASAPVDDGGVVFLPMDALPSDSTAVSATSITSDVALRSFRVGRESRPARVVHGPSRLSRWVGGHDERFETAFAPVSGTATMSIAIDGHEAARVTAEAGVWTAVRVPL